MFFLDEKRDDEQKKYRYFGTLRPQQLRQVTGDDIHYHNRA